MSNLKSVINWDLIQEATERQERRQRAARALAVMPAHGPLTPDERALSPEASANSNAHEEPATTSAPRPR